jgi:hypothetical protein
MPLGNGSACSGALKTFDELLGCRAIRALVLHPRMGTAHHLLRDVPGHRAEQEDPSCGAVPHHDGKEQQRADCVRMSCQGRVSILMSPHAFRASAGHHARHCGNDLDCRRGEHAIRHPLDPLVGPVLCPNVLVCLFASGLLPLLLLHVSVYLGPGKVSKGRGVG